VHTQELIWWFSKTTPFFARRSWAGNR
jgi:hypothetical protein